MFTAVSCRLRKDIENTADVLCRQRLMFECFLNFSYKYIVKLSVHCIVVNVTDFWKHLEKLDNISIAQSLQLWDHTFNYLAEQLSRPLVRSNERLHYFQVVMWCEFSHLS